MNDTDRKLLEALVWRTTHRDFKSKREDGTKVVLHLIEGKGTCSVSLKAFTDAELYWKLPRSEREKLASDWLEQRSGK